MDEKGNDKEEFIEKINISSELKNNNEKKEEENEISNSDDNENNFDEYDIKKTPVMILYIKIMYWIILFFLILLGIYFF